MRWLRRILTAAAFSAALASVPVLSGCTGSTYGTARLVVATPPPPPRAVYVQPRAGYVWVPGRWMRYDNQWVWREGYWMRARPGYVYVPGRWERRGDQYYWIDARWRRTEAYHRERKARGEHREGDVEIRERQEPRVYPRDYR